ncbi:Uncharacterized protein TCM_046286 [Theobroma cacao]|uniref:Uncharacterized protein n=1 Tax=Theobroma cacao TaxID=3641 RepID=S1S3Y4_THECC|nr:Uncharacterized protein TCM_046286 [Theobroma cacao]
MTSIGDQTTSRLNALVQDSVSVANRETMHTSVVKRYESEGILQALDNRVSCHETVINHEVWSNFKMVEDSIEQLGSNSDELRKGWHNMVDSLICHNVGLDELMVDNSNHVFVANGDIAHIGVVCLDDTGQPQASNPHGKTHLNLEVFLRQLEKNCLKYTHGTCGEPDEELWWKETTRQRGRCLNQVGENVSICRSVTYRFGQLFFIKLASRDLGTSHPYDITCVALTLFCGCMLWGMDLVGFGGRKDEGDGEKKVVSRIMVPLSFGTICGILTLGLVDGFDVYEPCLLMVRVSRCFLFFSVLSLARLDLLPIAIRVRAEELDSHTQLTNQWMPRLRSTRLLPNYL